MTARTRRAASSCVMAAVFVDVDSDDGLGSDDDFAGAKNETIQSSRSDSSDEKGDTVGPVTVMYVRGLLTKNLHVNFLWDRNFGVNFIERVISRDRFKTILKYLRFDAKLTRSDKINTDKFTHIREISSCSDKTLKKFITLSFHRQYTSNCYGTADDHLWLF